MIRVAGLDARGILEECLKLAAEQFANTSEADLPAAIEQEIVRDLLRMQTQPVIMDNYRRFVVFRTKQDVCFADASKSGVRVKPHFYCLARADELGRITDRVYEPRQV